MADPLPSYELDLELLRTAAVTAGIIASSYFRRDLKEFDARLKVQGSPFQQKVWAGLRRIPSGTTWSYGQLANHIGAPNAQRAVGLANGKNPVAIIVPCHRVIGANGTMVGYGGGLDRKGFLLALEGASTRLL